MLVGIGVIIFVAIVLIASSAYYLKPNKDTVLNFLKDNPEKSAIKLVRNGEVLVERSATKMMPLASTVKIIIAIEYAEQAAKGMIDPDEKVAISELNPYYVPNTDGGAHPGWLKSVSATEVDDEVTIRQIAKGMIVYSSNANTEYLCHRLGLDKINARLVSLGVKDHSEIYNIVSALFVGKELFPGMKVGELETKLRALPMEEYINATHNIHEKLIADKEYKNDLGELGMKIQRVWSDLLPSSTVEEYVDVMAKINSRTYFDVKTQKYLDEVMEYLLDNPQNRTWLKHTGMKGGSTAFVLTKALYAHDKKSNRTELAYFFNDLGFLENMKLQQSMNEFELRILEGKDFLEKVKEELGNN